MRPGPCWGATCTVEEVAASFCERAQDQGVALLVSKAPELPGTWMGDPVRLSQILQNLLGNAIKFTREGRVTLSLERVGENLVFQVDDWAVPAGGTRLAGLRLLVAEDNEVNRAVLAEMLAAEGALVTLVDNGRRALAAVAAPGASWDAVLMDVQMPEMDGLEATRRILELAPALPVIGQTAHALAQEREKCRAAGMVAQVSKPIEFEDLVATVLYHARRAGPAPAPAPRGPVPPVTGGAATTPGDGVDWAGLAQRYKGNTAFIDRIAGLALSGHGALPADLRRWVAAGELAQIGGAAHALKGVTGNLMAAGVTALAEATQRAVHTGAADAPRLALQLADAVDGFLAALAAHLKRAGAGR